MSNTQFMFEKGVPPGIKRLVEPDEIMEIVVRVSNDLLGGWSTTLAKKADNLIKGKKSGISRLFGWEDEILTSGLITNALYGKNKYGLSDSDWDYLELLKAVRALAVFKDHTYDGKLGDPKQVDPKLISESLRNLAEATKESIFKVMLSDYSEAINWESPNVEEMCESSFGEKSQPGEGSEIISGDLLTSVNMGIIRTSPAGGMRVWRSFLPMVL
jgi:hypothetical protein